MVANTRVDILICTFQRDSLKRCLQSVLNQTVPNGVELGIVVADNARTAYASQCVMDMARNSIVPIHYIHAPAENISLARNACLDASTADWVVFIDDDEHAPADWLRNLWEDAHGFDVVFGDVLAQYPADAPNWITQSDFHSTMIAKASKPINTGFAGNVIMRWAGTLWYDQRFDLSLGKIGGEDTAFFNTLYHIGAALGASKGGYLWEPVPTNRLTFKWLSHRRFRSGQSYGDIALDTNGALPLAAFALLKVLFSLLSTILTFWHPKHRGFWALRAVFHMGVVSRSMRSVKQTPLHRHI
jgi:succinoglycan biosynthesis protein ExoM